MTAEQAEKILEAACDICRWPIECANPNAEDLTDHCDNCPVEAAVKMGHEQQNIKIEIGQTLPRSTWLAVRDDLAQVFPYIGELFQRMNYEGKGEQDKEEFLAEGQLAIQALTYVAEFATDKCRIIVLPDKKV